MNKETELLEKLQKAVIEYEDEEVEKLSNEVITIGMDPQKAIVEGLAKGMRNVGELFENEEYSIPEVLLCAEALEVGLKILKPQIKSAKREKPYKIIICTVEGDIHNIGKDMVKMMFEVGGFNVTDLGIDVGAEKIIEEINKDGGDIVALSTMMSTTLLSMENIIKKVRENYAGIKIMVGGAVVTREIANRFMADGWAENAAEALKKALDISKNIINLKSGEGK